MKTELLSSNINNPIAAKKNVIISVIFDYFLTLITTLFVFFLALILANNLPMAKNTINEYNNNVTEVKKYVNTTHLLRYDLETGNQRDVNTDANSYLKTIAKTSAYIYDLPYPVMKEDSTFDVTNKIKIEETFLYQRNEYTFDNISYFYLKFMPLEEGIDNYLLDGVDYASEIENYIYLKAMKYETLSNYSNMFIDASNEKYSEYSGVLPRYLVLEEELAKKVINRIVYNDTTDTEAEIASRNIQSAYLNGVQFGIDKIENGSVKYRNLVSAFEKTYENYALIGFVTYIISFFIGYFFLLLLGRAMGGKFITVTQKVRQLEFSRKDEVKPSFVNFLIYHAVALILHFSSSIFGFYFTGYTGILNITLFGPINMFVVELILLFFSIISLVFVGFTSKNQSLPLFLSQMVVKDMKVYEEISLPGDEKPKE